MTILLLGAEGQVGSELRRSLLPLGSVIAFGHREIDLENQESLRSIVQHYRPSTIVNAAAYTAVDKAETEIDRAEAVNAIAPGILAEEADAISATLVHYSTDYVFDGSKTSPYIESDPTNPLSVYGRTKRDGEVAVRRCQRHLLIRTGWVFGAQGSNFVKKILQLAAERSSLRVVSDRVGVPTSAPLLAQVTAQILGQMMGASTADPRWGLYHVVAGGEASWHGFASYIIARARSRGAILQAAPETVEPISATEFQERASRPMNSRLATTKAQRSFSLTMPDWTVGVNAVLNELIPETAR